MKITLLALAAAATTSCGLIPEEETFQDVPYVGDYESEDYVLSECIRMDLEVKVKVSVKYVPLQTVSMSFDVGGVKYGNIYAEAGQSVHEGDLLIELDTEQLLENVEKEEKSIEANERRMRQLEEDRTLELRMMEYRASSMTYAKYVQNVEQINSRYDLQIGTLADANEVSRIRVEAYEEDIRKRQIYAPFDGVITYVISPDPDAVSQASKRVVTIADSSLSLFKGSTEYFSLFEPGLECTVVSGNVEYDAVVCSEEELGIPETAHVEGKSGTIYLALRETVYTLSDSASGSVTLTEAKKSNVLCVPKKAVSEINGKTVVYYPDEFGLRTYKEIVTGLNDGSYVEVISGLEEGDPVIIR
ncbi:MAG: hypothetical protein IJL78_05025 [Lachnospiraceae bacterium]|nr:hypothetical protein [Lachnospiraceae bacterium]